MAVTLLPEELGLVRSILADYLSNLRMEISDTDDYDMRQSLKKREAALKALLERIDQEHERHTRGVV